MRRGRTILIILLFVLVLIIVGVLASRMMGGGGGAQAATPTPGIQYVKIIIAGQNISPGAQITENMLSFMEIPQDKQIVGQITDKAAVVNMFAKQQIPQGQVIMDSMLSPTPGISTSPGSPWAAQIPSQLTAISIPITRLSAVAYGVRANDFVNVIATMLIVDVDASFQTILPNHTAGVTGAGVLPEMLPMLTVQINSGGEVSTQGRTELDPTLNNAVYVVPSERQRPRLVTKMIMQNVQVLQVGNFPLPGEEEGAPTPVPVGTTPTPGGAPQQATQVMRPDIITLLVTPQDAVVLTYLIYSGQQITLTLRNPNDFDFITSVDAVTLQYLLSQYDISLPAKLPYSLEPRVDVLLPPALPNDVIIATPQP